jgi:hypothetical protein
VKKTFVAFLLTLLCALGVAAEGRLRNDGSLNVPFDFVAVGKSLPAGTYNIDTLSGSGSKELRLSSFENRSSVFILPMDFESSLHSRVKLSFQQVGDAHILSSIETPEGVYLIPTRTSATAIAKAKHGEGTTTAGAK